MLPAPVCGCPRPAASAGNLPATRLLRLGIGYVQFTHALAGIGVGNPNDCAFAFRISAPLMSDTRIVFFAMNPSSRRPSLRSRSYAVRPLPAEAFEGQSVSTGHCEGRVDEKRSIVSSLDVPKSPQLRASLDMPVMALAA